MTGHDAPKVVQYRTVIFSPESIKVDDLAEMATDFQMGEELRMGVRYCGMAKNPTTGKYEAVVHVYGHGNFAVDPERITR